MRRDKVRRVLIYRLGSLGDMLVALPALHLAARAFPNAERRMLTNFPVNAKAPAAAAVLDHTGLVDGYFRYETGTRSPKDLLRLAWTILRWRPQVLVYLGSSRGVKAALRDERFFRLCGIRRIVGVPLTEGMQRNFYGRPTGGRDGAMGDGHLEPEAARLARNIGELGGIGEFDDPARLEDPASWDLHLTAEERAAADRAIGEVDLGSEAITACVGTKVQSKDWGRDNWRALLAAMARELPGRPLLLVGAPEESEASEFAAEGWRANGGGAVVNLCGVLKPRESAAAIARTSLFVGHDSGPMHLAAAVGTPCVAIFAARNIPRQWFPFGQQHRVVYHRVECWGCGLETCIEQQKKCLMSITVDEVMEKVREVLGTGC
ncbi:glycosyltransferase family 9 protein [Bryocella elongata]|nr:glycosyltransferase family 9 protein [Bryocella elongata]